MASESKQTYIKMIDSNDDLSRNSKVQVFGSLAAPKGVNDESNDDEAMAKSAFLDAHPQRTAPASCSAEEGLVQEDKDATLAMDLQEQEMKLARMGVKGEKVGLGGGRERSDS